VVGPGISLTARVSAALCSAQKGVTQMRCITRYMTVLVIGSVLSVLMASTALAHGGQEFIKASTKNGFKGEKGTFTFFTIDAMIPCNKEKFSGEDGGDKTMSVKNVKFKWEECTAENLETGQRCSAKSKGASGAEEIVTNTLMGQLGWSPYAQVESLVSLEFLPTSGRQWLTIEGSCITETAVTGSVAAGVRIYTAKQLPGEFVFALLSGKQAIKTVCLLGTLCEGAELMLPKLTAFGEEGWISSTENFEYEEATLITKGT
jgi:hypothetical protein